MAPTWVPNGSQMVSLSPLGASWAPEALLEPSWRAPGGLWEASWSHLGGVLGRLGVVLGRLGGSWGNLGSELGVKRAPKGCPRGSESELQAESGETLIFDDSLMNFNDF